MNRRAKLIRDLILYLIIALLAVILMLKWVPNQFLVHGDNQPVTRISPGSSFAVLFFHRNGCPHCERARPVLKKVQDKYTQVDWVTFNLSYGDEDMFRAYESWLAAAGLKEAVTPLIVVAPRSPSPWIAHGFLDERTDRPPIENKIRQKLGLDPIQFDAESIFVPFRGFTVLSEKSNAESEIIIGFFSGMVPFVFVILLIMPFHSGWAFRQQVLCFTMGCVLALISKAALPSMEFGMTLTWLRAILGLGLTGGALVALIGYMRAGMIRIRWNLFAVIPLLILASFMDGILLQWLGAMRRELGISMTSLSWGAGALPWLMVATVIGLANYYRKNKHPRLHLVYLLVVGVIAYWGILLLSGHEFSGYGPWIFRP